MHLNVLVAVKHAHLFTTVSAPKNVHVGRRNPLADPPSYQAAAHLKCLGAEKWWKC